jgi:hypothetical protein
MAEAHTRELRKFGLTVGGAFAAFGAVSWWRGHTLPPKILWTVAVFLLVPGAFAPAVLAPVQRVWMAFAAALAFVNTRIILAVLFYVVLTPIGFVLRLFHDPVNRSMKKDTAGSQWIKRTPQPVELARYERQF